MGLFLRWVLAFVLPAATSNPTSRNYVRWSVGVFRQERSVVALMGLLLAIDHIIDLRAPLRSTSGVEEVVAFLVREPIANVTNGLLQLAICARLHF